MSTSPARTPAGDALSVPRATALYIGALFGPGLLLLPGLAAEQAGPASIIAWLALLGLSAIFAVVFAALGKAVPSAAGAAGYAAAGLGRLAATMTRWWFLAGVIAGAPIVCLIGASYVTALTGGGPLARVIGIAFTVTAVLYLGLAVATVSCLGRGADLTVPLADLLQLAIGPAGRAVAAAAALVLTAGSVNAYISGASEMLRELTAVPSHKAPNGPGRPPRLSAHALLGVIALAGLVLIGLSALRLADIIALVSVPTAMFLCVYLSCTASATRILTGPARVAAAVAVLAVLAVLAFCGWQALLAVAVVAAVAGYPALRGRPERGITPGGIGWQAAAAGPAVSVASFLSQPRSAGRMHDDRGTGARQALRCDRSGRRPHLHDPARHGYRIPRPERRRQDHHHAADSRPGPPVR